jgi:hypothetical protein
MRVRTNIATRRKRDGAQNPERFNYCRIHPPADVAENRRFARCQLENVHGVNSRVHAPADERLACRHHSQARVEALFGKLSVTTHQCVKIAERNRHLKHIGASADGHSGIPQRVVRRPSPGVIAHAQPPPAFRAYAMLD